MDDPVVRTAPMRRQVLKRHRHLSPRADSALNWFLKRLPAGIGVSEPQAAPSRTIDPKLQRVPVTQSRLAGFGNIQHCRHIISAAGKIEREFPAKSAGM